MATAHHFVPEAIEDWSLVVDKWWEDIKVVETNLEQEVHVCLKLLEAK